MGWTPGCWLGSGVLHRFPHTPWTSGYMGLVFLIKTQGSSKIKWKYNMALQVLTWHLCCFDPRIFVQNKFQGQMCQYLGRGENGPLTRRLYDKDKIQNPTKENSRSTCDLIYHRSKHSHSYAPWVFASHKINSCPKTFVWREWEWELAVVSWDW